MSETLVEAQGLAKRFGDFVALQPLDVKVQSGEFFGVFGPNGPGKSISIRLSQVNSPTEGGAKFSVSTSQTNHVLSRLTLESFPNPILYHTLRRLNFLNSLHVYVSKISPKWYWLDWFGMTDKRTTLSK